VESVPLNHSARRINALAAHLNAKRYLEIGVSTGTTFQDVAIAERTGADPAFAFDIHSLTNETTRLLPQTSDSFFATEPMSSLFDIVFIDGLHTFEQVVRDFSNAILHTHSRSVIVIDDTLPDDVYSAHPDLDAIGRYRRSIGSGAAAWHGDVFKIIFYVHDFWPGLNYRTIVKSGNPQTLVWRAKAKERTPLYNNLEKISRLTYFDLLDHMTVLQPADEEEAINLALAQLNG
jgi:Methyltransferase domain